MNDGAPETTILHSDLGRSDGLVQLDQVLAHSRAPSLPGTWDGLDPRDMPASLQIHGEQLATGGAELGDSAARVRALFESATQGLNLWLYVPERLREWIQVVDPHWSLVDERLETAAGEFLREPLFDRYEGVVQVTRDEDGGAVVRALLAGADGARPVTKGMIEQAGLMWERALHRSLGLALPVGRGYAPPEERATAALMTWRVAQDRYRGAVIARHAGQLSDGGLRRAWRLASVAERSYLSLWGRYARARYGVRLGAPESRYQLGGGARFLQGFSRRETRQVLEGALHQLLPRQQLFMLSARPAGGGSLDVRVHHFVPPTPKESERLREQLPAAVDQRARSSRPDLVVGEIDRSPASTSPGLVQRGLGFLARGMPAGMARAVGAKVEKLGHSLESRAYR